MKTTFAEAENDEEDRTVILSKVGETKCREFYRRLNYSLLEEDEEADDEMITFVPFKWMNDEPKDTPKAQRHLQSQLERFGVKFGREAYKIYDVHTMMQLLSVSDPKTGKITGGTDLIIAAYGLALESSIDKACVIIELKPWEDKDNSDSHAKDQAQAKMELLAAAMKSNNPVLQVLSDLKTRAHCYSFEDEHHVRHQELSLTGMARRIANHLLNECTPDRKQLLSAVEEENDRPSVKVLKKIKKARLTPLTDSLEYEHFSDLMDMTLPGTRERSEVVDQYFGWRSMFV